MNKMKLFKASALLCLAFCGTLSWADESFPIYGSAAPTKNSLWSICDETWGDCVMNPYSYGEVVKAAEFPRFDYGATMTLSRSVRFDVKENVKTLINFKNMHVNMELRWGLDDTRSRTLKPRTFKIKTVYLDTYRNLVIEVAGDSAVDKIVVRDQSLDTSDTFRKLAVLNGNIWDLHPEFIQALESVGMTFKFPEARDF